MPDTRRVNMLLNDTLSSNTNEDLEPCTKCLLRNTIHDPFKTFLFPSANKCNDDTGEKNNAKPANENHSSLTSLIVSVSGCS